MRKARNKKISAYDLAREITKTAEKLNGLVREARLAAMEIKVRISLSPTPSLLSHGIVEGDVMKTGNFVQSMEIKQRLARFGLPSALQRDVSSKT